MINIFFGSTINREQVEKEQIELFVRNLNKKFKEIKSKVDVRVKPLFKNEINNLQALINEAEYSFFIIFKSVTTEDTDEIIYAVKQYEEHNKPKVYVYFKTINDDDSINDEINILKDKISSEFAHYYQVFTNIEEIKYLQILKKLNFD